MKVTCLILTFNESSRIRLALGHAFRWADEVLVVDKSSTDDTREIARAAGGRVETIPFSRQGHEKVRELLALASNDWVWGFTPGEVPTARVVEQALHLAHEKQPDAVIVPHRYYSFGEHDETLQCPWALSYQPRLVDRTRCPVTEIVHAAIQPREGAVVNYDAQTYVLHQTHATAPEFIRSHVDYMFGEVENGTPEENIQRAAAHIQQMPLSGGIRKLAWDWYWQGVILLALDKHRSKHVRREYAERAHALLCNEWP